MFLVGVLIGGAVICAALGIFLMTGETTYEPDKFPPMPPAEFDPQMFFDENFPAERCMDKDGRMRGYMLDYKLYREKFINSEFAVSDDMVTVAVLDLNTYISISDYHKYSMRGDWDRPDFTDADRQIAWRLEVVNKKLSRVY